MVSGSGCLGIAPVVADWNGDGVQDLVAGLADRRVQFFENTGTTSAPVFAAPVDVEISIPASVPQSIDVGDRAMPAVADWNRDGRSDLIVGALDGKIRVYLDTVASGEPYFQAELIVQDADGDLVVPTGRSAPAVIDLNGDGRRDLVAGNTEGQLLFYANTGTDATPEFEGWRLLKADGAVIDLDGTPRSRPWVGDFNDDGVADLVFGAEDGLVRVALATSGPTQTAGLNEVGEPGELHVHTFEVAGSGSSTCLPPKQGVHRRPADPR